MALSTQHIQLVKRAVDLLLIKDGLSPSNVRGIYLTFAKYWDTISDEAAVAEWLDRQDAIAAREAIAEYTAKALNEQAKLDEIISRYPDA